MTEPIQDQLSAFVDDELSSEECAFFVRRLQRDPDAAQRALRFSTIGAALRGELVQPDPGILLRRVDAALDGTLGQATLGRRRAGGSAALWRPALGVGISAGVAAVAVLLLRTVNMGGGDVEAGTSANRVPALQRAEPTTYVVPREPGSGRLIGSPRLTNYLMHHGEYSSRLGRTMVNSNVVVSVDDAIELEEAPADVRAAQETQ